MIHQADTAMAALAMCGHLLSRDIVRMRAASTPEARREALDRVMAGYTTFGCLLHNASHFVHNGPGELPERG